MCVATVVEARSLSLSLSFFPLGAQVKSDVGFDHMHKHGPGDDTDELPSLQKHLWRAVGVLQLPGIQLPPPCSFPSLAASSSRK